MTFSVNVRISQAIANEYAQRSAFREENKWPLILSIAGVHRVSISTAAAMLADAEFQVHKDGPFGAGVAREDLPVRNAYAALEEQLRGVLAGPDNTYPAIAAPTIFVLDGEHRSEWCLNG